jgi:hypothetical protein
MNQQPTRRRQRHADDFSFGLLSERSGSQGRHRSVVGSAGGVRGLHGVADWSGVASRRRIESGRGQACPGPSHTTRHAGPHRAVRSAFPEAAVGIGEPFQASGLVPVGVRQGALEWPGSSDAPVALL